MNAKIQLFKGKTHSDGTHPVQLQYYVDGKTKRKTLARCRPEDWDERSCRLKPRARNASMINLRLTEAITDAERLIYSVLNGENSIDKIFNNHKAITLADGIELEKERFKKQINPSMVKRMRSYENILSRYCNTSATGLQQINLRWFECLIIYLKGKGNQGATITKIIDAVKNILKSYYKLADDISNLKVPITKAIKQKLTVEEFSALESVDLSDDQIAQLARDIFALQVYLRGIRIGDILQAKCSAFRNGRFYYKADKTGKEYNINVVSAAQPIIDRYFGKGDYLFPLFTWSLNSRLSSFENEKRRIACKESCTTIVNKALKEVAKKAGISKPLTTHIARHTFARMAIDKVHNPMVTMELLGHSNLKVHQQYLKDIRNEQVLDQVANEIFSI